MTSGQIVQGLTSSVFSNYGFRVVERARLHQILSEQQLSLSGLIDESQSVRIGKLLGANAIVVGEVGQWETLQRHTDTVYIPLPLYGAIAPFPIQGQQWAENWVSVSLRVIDVETGELVFSGSGQYERGVRNPPQQICNYILQSIVAKWFGNQQQRNVVSDEKNKSQRNYPQNVHQEQTKSEQLRKIEELEKDFPFEMIKKH